MHLKKKRQNQNFQQIKHALSSLSIADYIKETDKELAYKGNYSITLPADSTAVAISLKPKRVSLLLLREIELQLINTAAKY